MPGLSAARALAAGNTRWYCSSRPGWATGRRIPRERRIFRYGYDDPEYVALARAPRAVGRARGGVRPAPAAAGAAAHLRRRGTGRRCRCARPGRPARGPRRGGGRAPFPVSARPAPALLEPASAVIAAGRALAALAAAFPVLWGRPGHRPVPTTASASRSAPTAGLCTAQAAIVCAGPWTAACWPPGSASGLGHPGAGRLPRPGRPRPAAECRSSSATAPFPYGLPVPDHRCTRSACIPGGPPADPDRRDDGAAGSRPDGWPGWRAGTCPASARSRCAPSAASTTTPPTRTSSWTGPARS